MQTAKKNYPLPAFVYALLFVYSAMISAAFAQNGDKVAVSVNGTAITAADIAKRVAFLRMQHHTGNLPKIAEEDLINETLQRAEISKRGMGVSQADVDKAYASFAAGNHLNLAQLNEIMNQSGITPAHFKAYIRDQMGWGRLVSARFQAESTVTQQDAVQRMLKNGGKKPGLNEYLLKQVILVIPASQRTSSLGKRMAEANLMRGKITGCDNIYAAGQGIMDVTIRTLGRFLEPQIPGEWVAAVKATQSGKATQARATQRGVEFLVVCSVRKVTDDRVAQLVYTMEDSRNSAQKGVAVEKKYMQELRSAATIQKP